MYISLDFSKTLFWTMQVGIIIVGIRYLKFSPRGTLPINSTTRQSIYPDKLQKLKWVIVTIHVVEIKYATAKRFKKNPRP